MTSDRLQEDGLSEQANYTLWENGVQIATGSATNAAERVEVSSGPADYKFEYDISRSAPWTRLSSRTLTDWAFHSDHAQGSGGTLPPNGICGLTFGTDCGVIPLLFPRYDLGVDSRGQAAGGSAMNVQVGFQRTDGSQAPDPDTATLAVTFDDGATWTDAHMTSLGGGRFAFTFTNPAATATNGFAGLRLTASDSAGNGVTQTLLRTYALR